MSWKPPAYRYGLPVDPTQTNAYSEWCGANCKGDYFFRDDSKPRGDHGVSLVYAKITLLFEREEDAALFKLFWG
jgi:hypothetical protein